MLALVDGASDVAQADCSVDKRRVACSARELAEEVVLRENLAVDDAGLKEMIHGVALVRVGRTRTRLGYAIKNTPFDA